VAAVAVVVLLALPSASLAGSAGDNQYQDPFANTPTQPKQTPSSGTQGSSTPSASPAPTPTATTATPPPSGTASGELPRTGFPVLPVAGAGVLLVGAGLLLLRRRTA
jgi:LPXTG-motif cell wall-anchored protein